MRGSQRQPIAVSRRIAAPAADIFAIPADTPISTVPRCCAVPYPTQ